MRSACLVAALRLASHHLQSSGGRVAKDGLGAKSDMILETIDEVSGDTERNDDEDGGRKGVKK